MTHYRDIFISTALIKCSNQSIGNPIWYLIDDNDTISVWNIQKIPRHKWTINETLIFLKIVSLAINRFIPGSFPLVKTLETWYSVKLCHHISIFLHVLRFYSWDETRKISSSAEYKEYYICSVQFGQMIFSKDFFSIDFLRQQSRCNYFIYISYSDVHMSSFKF